MYTNTLSFKVTQLYFMVVGLGLVVLFQEAHVGHNILLK